MLFNSSSVLAFAAVKPQTEKIIELCVSVCLSLSVYASVCPNACVCVHLCFRASPFLLQSKPKYNSQISGSHVPVQCSPKQPPSTSSPCDPTPLDRAAKSRTLAPRSTVQLLAPFRNPHKLCSPVECCCCRCRK